jgi:hypothetical protein
MTVWYFYKIVAFFTLCSNNQVDDWTSSFIPPSPQTISRKNDALNNGEAKILKE